MFGKKKHKNELAIPPAAAQNPDGIELARIWAAVGKQQSLWRQVYGMTRRPGV